MAKVLIAYATRSQKTLKIAELIAEGVRMAGHEAELKPAAEIKKEADLAGYDGLVLGSPTYHGQMMQAMMTLLFTAEKAGLAGKPGGAFGSYGWSGEAAPRIHETMKNVLGMRLAPDALMLKNAGVEGAMAAAQGYGREVAGLL